MNYISSLLTSGSKRRRRLFRLAVWLLHVIRERESIDLQRFSDELDNFDPYQTDYSQPNFCSLEDAYLSSEYAVDCLDSAIDELEFVY